MADRKLRIAVVTETYPPEINGVAMTISRMVEGLRQNHEVELIRPRQPNLMLISESSDTSSLGSLEFSLLASSSLSAST